MGWKDLLFVKEDREKPAELTPSISNSENVVAETTIETPSSNIIEIINKNICINSVSDIFIDMMASLSGVISDERTLFSATFLSCKKSNRSFSKSLLLKALEEKQLLVKKEINDFEEEMGRSTVEVTTMENNIKNHDDMIFTLQNKIDNLKKESKDIQSQILAKTTEIGDAKYKFKIATDFISKGITNLSSKINEYITEK